MKKKKILFPLAILFLCLVLSDVIYGVVRFFLLKTDDVSALDALFKVLWEALPALVVLLAALVGTLIFHRKRVKEPVCKLARRVKTLPSDVEKGAFPAPVAAAGYVGELSSALQTTQKELAALLERTIENTDRETERRVRLDIARKICASVSPRIVFGGLTYGVCARTEAAEDVGADFCDAFALDKRRICISVCDVWGKGLPAALFASEIRSGLREHLSVGKTPAEALCAVNAALCSHNPETLAATLFCAVFNLETGELRFANAGHLPPVITGEEGRFLRMQAGNPIGVYPDAAIADEVYAIRPGEGLVLYTDGVVDAQKGDARFGFDGLLAALKERCATALSAEMVTDGLMDAVKAFGKSGDDAAVLALYYPVGVQKLLRPALEDLDRMRELLSDWLQDDPRKKNILLACEEIFTNIVDHAGAKAIQIGCEREDNSLIIRFTDDGEPFNPLQAESTEKELFSYSEGGMGMTIIRRIAGEIFYRTKQNLNVLTIRFPIIHGI